MVTYSILLGVALLVGLILASSCITNLLFKRHLDPSTVTALLVVGISTLEAGAIVFCLVTVVIPPGALA